jgi:hypothetical protein
MPKELQKVVGTRPIRPDGVDKVTGRANFGADMVMPGMLWGKVKRSPHAHARIMSINIDKALKLPGIKAIVTADDFPPIANEEAFVGEGPMNFRDLSRNCMAREKVLYDGHAVAAVAATSPSIAEEACELIEVEYHVLPYVIDVEEAMKPDAPLLHDDLFTQGVDPKPTHPSNIAKVVAFSKGTSTRASATPMSSSNGAIRTRRCTRPISSRTPASCRPPPMANARSGARARASSWCAPIARNCSASTSPTSAQSQPRSAAGLAGRRSSISNPSRSHLQRKRGDPLRW